MSEQKTPDLFDKSIEQYAEEYAEIKYPLEKLIDFEKITVLQVAAQSAFLSGAEKQKELDAEEINNLKTELAYFKNGRQIKEVHHDEPVFSIQESAKLKEQIKDYEQALKFCASEDLFTSNGEYEEMFKYNYKEWFQDKAIEVLKKWGAFEK